jgi:hypothetical protein
MRIKSLPSLSIDDVEKREARLNERFATDLKRFILSEYQSRRMQPQYAGEVLVSPQLVELNRLRPKRSWIPDVPDDQS